MPQDRARRYYLATLRHRQSRLAAPEVDGTVPFVFTLTATDGTNSASDRVTVDVRDRPASLSVTPPAPPPVVVIVPDSRDSAPSAAGSKGRLLVLPPAMTIDSAGYPESSVPEGIRGALQDAGAPVAPIPSDGTFDFPLEINGNGYALRHPSITLVPQNLTAGQPASIAVTLYDRYDIAYFAAYLDLPGSRAPYENETYVEYDGGTVQASDPGGIMSGESISIIQDPHNPSKKTVVLSATFSGPAGTADMVIRTENKHGGTLTVRVIDALRVVPAADPLQAGSSVDPEPGANPLQAGSRVDPEPGANPGRQDGSLLAVRMWSGFEPESMTDADLLALLKLDYPGADIPGWVMTELGVLVAKGLVTVEEFRTALEYVLGAR